MQTVIISLLGVLAVIRLGIWSFRKNQALDICASITQFGKVHESTLLGSVSELPSGRWVLEDPIWMTKYGGEPFFGEVLLKPDLSSPFLGSRVRVSGYFRCSETLHNPGRAQDGLGFFKEVRIVALNKGLKVMEVQGDTPWLRLAYERFRNWLEQLFRGAPGVLGFVQAVWTGDSRLLPAGLKDLFLEGGILQIIALSGQHVSGLVLLISLILQGVLLLGCTLGFRAQGGCGFFLVRFRRFLPLICCAVLMVTSCGAPSVLRTWFMACAALCLKLRRFQTTPLQLTTSSVALLILWQPELMGSISFFLSAFATALTCQVTRVGTVTSHLKNYLWVSTLMPLLVFPLSAFFFAKLSWMAPLYTILVSWFWDLILIPGGFALPFIVACLPQSVRFPFVLLLNRAWEHLVAQHLMLRDWIGTGFTTVVRPTWLEFGLTESLILWLIFSCCSIHCLFGRGALK